MLGDKWFSKCPKCGEVSEVNFHAYNPQLGYHGFCAKCEAEFWGTAGVWKEKSK